MAVDLGKQVGPLPVGAWIVVVGSGLGLAYYGYRNQDPKVSEVGTDNVSGDAGVGTGAVGGWTQTGPPTNDAIADVTVTTNEQWGVRAINWLIGQGYPAAVSDSAIRKYLAGNDPKPSIQEFTLQGIALSHFGSPPQPLPPAVNEPPVSVPPPVSQKPPPVVNNPPAKSFKYYTVKAWPAKGSTLWGIAEISYGNGKEYSRIFNANRSGTKRADGKTGMISNANLIRPGWVLLIP
jgi:hypothetical protein